MGQISAEIVDHGSHDGPLDEEYRVDGRFRPYSDGLGI
jgi:hypothetical protein